MRFLRELTLRTFLVPLFFLVAMTWHVESNAAQLTLSWEDNSTNEDGFKIERKTTTSGTFAQIATVGANISSYIDTGLADETTYCYRVRAYNASGNSAFSNEACKATTGNVDTDGDGLSDDLEINTYGTDPTLADTDGDGFSDGVEVSHGSDPLDPNSTPRVILAGDFTGDGIADLMIKDAEGILRLHEWHGNGWGLVAQIGTGWDFADYISGDFTGDGISDLMVRDELGDLYLYEWLGNGWGLVAQIGTGWFFTDYMSGDFTGDGISDLMVRDELGDLYLYEWLGAEQFETSQAPLALTPDNRQTLAQQILAAPNAFNVANEILGGTPNGLVNGVPLNFQDPDFVASLTDAQFFEIAKQLGIDTSGFGTSPEKEVVGNGWNFMGKVGRE